MKKLLTIFLLCLGYQYGFSQQLLTGRGLVFPATGPTTVATKIATYVGADSLDNSLATAKAVNERIRRTLIPGIKTVLFDEEFNRPNTSNIAGSFPGPIGYTPWTLFPGVPDPMGITNGKLTSGAVNALIATTIPVTKDYDVSIVISNATTTSGGVAALFVNIDVNNSLLIYMNSAYGGLDPFSIRQNVGGVATTLYAGSGTISSGDTVHATLTNGQLLVYKNSTLVTTVAYDSAHIKGNIIGIQNYLNSASAYDHLVVTSTPSTGFLVSHDGTLSGNGNTVPLSVTGGAYTLPTATPTVLGGVKIDNSTIVISGGVISAPSSGGYSIPAIRDSLGLDTTLHSRTYQTTSALTFNIDTIYVSNYAADETIAVEASVQARKTTGGSYRATKSVQYQYVSGSLDAGDGVLASVSDTYSPGLILNGYTFTITKVGTMIVVQCTSVSGTINAQLEYRVKRLK